MAIFMSFAQNNSLNLHLNRPVQATCLNDESFQESGIVLIISRANLPQLLLSCILHLANQVILCLQQLQAGSIQLCRVLTVAGNEKPCFIRYKIVTSGPDWIHHCWAFSEHRNIKSTGQGQGDTYILRRTSTCFSLRSNSCRIFFFSASTIWSFSMLNSCYKQHSCRHSTISKTNSRTQMMIWNRLSSVELTKATTAHSRSRTCSGDTHCMFYVENVRRVRILGCRVTWAALVPTFVKIA